MSVSNPQIQAHPTPPPIDGASLFELARQKAIAEGRHREMVNIGSGRFEGKQFIPKWKDDFYKELRQLQEEMYPLEPGNFVSIPKYLFEGWQKSNLSSLAEKILMLCIRFNWKRTWTKAVLKEINKYVPEDEKGVSARKVRKALNELIDKGYFSRESIRGDFEIQLTQNHDIVDVHNANYGTNRNTDTETRPNFAKWSNRFNGQVYIVNLIPVFKNQAVFSAKINVGQKNEGQQDFESEVKVLAEKLFQVLRVQFPRQNFTLDAFKGGIRRILTLKNTDGFYSYSFEEVGKVIAYLGRRGPRVEGVHKKEFKIGGIGDFETKFHQLAQECQDAELASLKDAERKQRSKARNQPFGDAKADVYKGSPDKRHKVKLIDSMPIGWDESYYYAIRNFDDLRLDYEAALKQAGFIQIPRGNRPLPPGVAAVENVWFTMDIKEAETALASVLTAPMPAVEAKQPQPYKERRAQFYAAQPKPKPPA